MRNFELFPCPSKEEPIDQKQLEDLGTVDWVLEGVVKAGKQSDEH